MNALQTEVHKRIANLAASIGAKYAIQLGDEVVGTLEVPKPPPPKGKRPGYKRVYNFVGDTGYNVVTNAMRVGDTAEWTVASGDYAKAFEATLRAFGRAHWGKDSSVTAATVLGETTKVELLRVL